MRLDCEHLFGDYFEPEAIYVIKFGNDFSEGSLLLSSREKLEGFGIDLTNAKLLMEAKGPFDMEEFVTKVVEPEVNPTVLLLKWKPGFVIGGFAGVSWPAALLAFLGRSTRARVIVFTSQRIRRGRASSSRSNRTRGASTW
jgi:hypothetical protein